MFATYPRGQPPRARSAPVPPQETSSQLVAACSTPNGSGTAQAGGKTPLGLRVPMWGQGCQPLAPVFFHDTSAGSSSSASVAGVARSSAVWLAEAGPLSTGFTPQGVLHLDACLWTPYAAVHASLSLRAISYAVHGHTFPEAFGEMINMLPLFLDDSREALLDDDREASWAKRHAWVCPSVAMRTQRRNTRYWQSSRPGAGAGWKEHCPYL
jgi:hypothetical protein